MTWNVAWSWESPQRVSTIAEGEGGVVVSSGLNLIFIEADGSIRWQVQTPFKVHSAAIANGKIGLLAAHAFYLMNTHDGSLFDEGRSTPGGFRAISSRPGGGWIVADRQGSLHLFKEDGRGLRRLDCGSLRMLLGWLDREHVVWLDESGWLWCGRISKDDKKRRIDDQTWSWSTQFFQGRLLLQSSDGTLWEGVPHPFGWDSLEQIQFKSLEPMKGVRTADGWWVLGIEGNLTSLSILTSEEDGVQLGQQLGDLLVCTTPDSMVTCSRTGLLRRWVAPHLSEAVREGRYTEAAKAAMARNWEERRQLFLRARDAEDLGKLSLAIELYETLGRTEDARRLLRRQKDGGE